MRSHAQTKTTTSTKNTKSSPEASQHWKIFGVVVVNFNSSPERSQHWTENSNHSKTQKNFFEKGGKVERNAKILINHIET